MSLLAHSVFDLAGDDILYEIFYTVAALDPPRVHRFRPDCVRIHLGWLTLSHVCRRWRTILVHDMPRLWAELPCNIPSALTTITERARNLPLALRTRVKFDIEKDVFMTCLNFSERIRKVANALVHRAYLFEYEPFSIKPDLGWYYALNQKHLPLLQGLRITEAGINSNRPEDYAGRALEIDAPNLRSAVISIRGSVNLLHASLVTLDVDSGCVELLRKPLDGLLRILAKQPNLESLTTSFQALDIDWTNRDISRVSVRLDHLKDIRIPSRTIADLLSFFRHVECPSVRRMRLSVRHSQSEDWLACVRLFERVALADGISTLNLHRSEQEHYFYALHHSPDDWDMSIDTVRGPLAVFETDFNVRGIPSPSFTDFYLAFFTLARPGAIRRIVFDHTITADHYYEMRPYFHSHSQDLSAVTSLWLNRRDNHDLLLPQKMGEDDEDDYVLHHVTELAVPHMYPSMVYEPGNDLEAWQLSDGQARWAKLAEVLKKRADSGHPIRRLVLIGKWDSVERKLASHEVDSYGLILVGEAGVHEVIDRRTVRRIDYYE
ncbi:hypothetical protein PENSPDRAFT_655680 [Peniophora sp. CONT]|nr:hypothetical protein PENSPDRAFT_655680 [Peniophora sp. CONT]